MTIASAIGLVKGFVYAEVLGSHALGYYGLVLIVSQFGVGVCSWGVMSALNYRLPIAFGKQAERLDETIDRSLGAVLATSTLTGVGYLIVVAALAPSDANVWLALSLASVITVATVALEFCLLLLRAEGRLLPLATIYITRSTLAAVLGAVAGSLWGYLGVIGAELGSILVVIAVARGRWVRLSPRRPTVDWVRPLIRWGVPLAVANTVVSATFLLDRVWVASTLSSRLGQYTFASYAVFGWAAVLGVLSQSTAPRLLRELGSGLEIRAVRTKAVLICVAICVAGLPGLAVLHFARPWLAQHLFPGYATGLEAMAILYIGGLLSVMSFPGFILGALRPSALLWTSGIGAATAAAGGAIMAASGAGLMSFAWVFVISQLVTAMLKLALLERVVRRPRAADTVRINAHLGSPA